MATNNTQDHVYHSNDETINNNTDVEKLPNNKDTDSSSGNVETVEDIPPLEIVDKHIERGVLRKLDYRIVPMVMWVYLMNMMDRGEFCRP